MLELVLKKKKSSFNILFNSALKLFNIYIFSSKKSKTMLPLKSLLKNSKLIITLERNCLLLVSAPPPASHLYTFSYSFLYVYIYMHSPYFLCFFSFSFVILFFYAFSKQLSNYAFVEKILEIYS